jgi:hypothetical protein
MGLALRDGTSNADPASLSLLSRDVDRVRVSLGVPERDAFELVVALRGLKTGGKPDVGGAEQSCRALKLARCDARALELLQKRSAP